MPRYILDTTHTLFAEGIAQILAAQNDPTATLKPQARTLHIIGRRWFAKTYGNTYHTAQIVINGQTVHRTPRAYGYGDQYLQSAVEWLKQSGHLPADCEHMGNTRFLREESGFDFTYECHDVRWQKDL